MTRIEWDRPGQKFFEVGVDRGVLYPKSGKGVPWNGLINVTEQPVGGEVAPYYLDGIRYYQATGNEEFEATIEAFTYPDEFSEFAGSHSDGYGLYFEQQEKSEFNLTYRTMVGSDSEGLDLGYKIHVVYYAVATPTQGSYKTISGTPEANPFSWKITTRQVRNVGGRKPFAHLIIDSTSAHSSIIKQIEDIMYGTKNTTPRLPGVVEFQEIFAKTKGLTIISNTSRGMSPLKISTGPGDLLMVDNFRSGLYERPRNSRLMQIGAGLHILE